MRTLKRSLTLWLGIVVLSACTWAGWNPAAAYADTASGGQQGQTNSAVQITGGKNFSVILKKDGTVWTWGQNDHGKLGLGISADSRAHPVQVPGLTDIVMISAGNMHTLALRSDGTVWAWGLNTSGELGDGTTTDRNAPVQVQGISDVVKVAAGALHSIAVTRDGSIWTWGNNSYGQLGNGTKESRSLPSKLKFNDWVTDVAAGAYHNLLVTKDGGYVYGWGDNSDGELGSDYTVDDVVTSPIQTSWVTHVEKVAAGYNFSIALDHDNNVYTWGKNDQGQLGDGSQDSSNDPSSNSMLGLKNYDEEIIDIAAGYSHAMARGRDGTVYIWGSGTSGETGLGTEGVAYTAPSVLFAVKGAVAVGAGYHTSYAVMGDDSVYAWGSNMYSQLGDGTKTNRNIPVKVVGLSASAEQPVPQGGGGAVTNSAVRTNPLSAGENGTAFIQSGRLFAWGDSLLGQTGTGAVSVVRTPKEVAGIDGPSAVAEGTAHSLAVAKDGTVWSWGSNMFGQLGGPADGSRTSPALIDGIGQAVDVAAGSYHSAVLLRDGTVWTFGSNLYGQLGDESVTGTSRTEPGKVTILSQVTAIASGANHLLALEADGTVWAWGDNSSGQLGDGTLGMRGSPSQVPGLTDVVAIAAGRNDSLALKKDGTVWSWGSNLYGELGDGTTIRRTSPVQVHMPATTYAVKAITAGGYHSLALLQDGTVLSWGANSFGQLGDGSGSSRSLPKPIAGLTGVKAIAAGGTHSAALKSDGTLWTWGGNAMGQLGTDGFTNRSLPVMVTGFPQRFTDIAGHWAAEAIALAAEKGYVNGYADGSFHPEELTSRAEFVKLAAAALQLKVQAAEPGQIWYQGYVDAAVKAGWLDADTAGVSWDLPITRREMAAIALHALSIDVNSSASRQASDPVMEAAVKAGVLQGYADGSFGPEDGTTRAQAVTVIERIQTLRSGGVLSGDK